MPVYDLKCCDLDHASRSEEPDWNDGVLGTIEFPFEVDPEDSRRNQLLCPACARLREQP